MDVFLFENFVTLQLETKCMSKSFLKTSHTYWKLHKK